MAGKTHMLPTYLFQEFVEDSRGVLQSVTLIHYQALPWYPAVHGENPLISI